MGARRAWGNKLAFAKHKSVCHEEGLIERGLGAVMVRSYA